MNNHILLFYIYNTMKIKIKDFNNKIEEKDVVVRNELHFEVQKKTRSNVFKPKKGKGSFRRTKVKGSVNNLKIDD